MAREDLILVITMVIMIVIIIVIRIVIVIVIQETVQELSSPNFADTIRTDSANFRQ